MTMSNKKITWWSDQLISYQTAYCRSLRQITVTPMPNKIFIGHTQLIFRNLVRLHMCSIKYNRCSLPVRRMSALQNSFHQIMICWLVFFLRKRTKCKVKVCSKCRVLLKIWSDFLAWSCWEIFHDGTLICLTRRSPNDTQDLSNSEPWLDIDMRILLDFSLMMSRDLATCPTPSSYTSHHIQYGRHS